MGPIQESLSFLYASLAHSLRLLAKSSGGPCAETAAFLLLGWSLTQGSLLGHSPLERSSIPFSSLPCSLPGAAPANLSLREGCVQFPTAQHRVLHRLVVWINCRKVSLTSQSGLPGKGGAELLGGNTMFSQWAPKTKPGIQIQVCGGDQHSLSKYLLTCR